MTCLTVSVRICFSLHGCCLMSSCTKCWVRCLCLVTGRAVRMLRRPKATDSEEDILREQHQLLSSGTSPSVVNVVRRPDKRRGEQGTPDPENGEHSQRDVVTIEGSSVTFSSNAQRQLLYNFTVWLRYEKSMDWVLSAPLKKWLWYCLQCNNTFCLLQDLPDDMPTLTPAPPKKSCFKKAQVRFEEDAEERLDKHDTHISAVLSRIVVSSTLNTYSHIRTTGYYPAFMFVSCL